jgi:hypothetical protein
MSPGLKASSTRWKFLLLIVLLFISATLILARFKVPEERSSTQEQAGTPSSAQDPRKEQLEAELVTITPTGFEPGEITRPQGRFLFAIDNRSGLEDVQMYLERETGARVNSSLTRTRKLAWRDVMDLPPGTYILRATFDESWRCRITITPR